MSEFFCGYCLDICLFACKRRCLDYQYLIGIFKPKVGKKVGKIGISSVVNQT